WRRPLHRGIQGLAYVDEESREGAVQQRCQRLRLGLDHPLTSARGVPWNVLVRSLAKSPALRELAVADHRSYRSRTLFIVEEICFAQRSNDQAFTYPRFACVCGESLKPLQL